MSRPLCLSLLALIAIPISGQLVFAQTAADVERIVETWNARRKQAGTWRYVAQGKQFIPKGRFSNLRGFVPPAAIGEILPPEDKVFEESLTWILDPTNSRVRKEHTGQIYHFDKKTFYPFEHTSSFDGVSSYSLSPFDEKRKKAGEYGVEFTRSPNMITFEPCEFPVFLDRGIIPKDSVDLRTTADPISPADFKTSGRTTINDVECFVLQRTRREGRGHEEFMVDAGADHKIHAWRKYLGDTLRFSLDISYTKQPDGAQLSGWHSTYFDNDGFVTGQRKLDLQSIDKNPSDVTPASYILKPKPGQYASFGRGPLLIVQEDGSMVPAKKGEGR